MPAILLELDPTSEDATNVPVVLTDTTWRILEMDVSPPEIDAMFASSADTEGEPLVQGRHHNRVMSFTFLAKSTTDALTQTAVQGLMMKLDKMRREGGTLKWTTQAGTVVVADVLFAQVKSEMPIELYALNKAVRLTVDFTCEPYLRGTPVQLSDHAETTLPVAIGVDTSVGGDVPATVKILIDEDQAVNQWWVVWGVQSRYYDSASSAALFYEAEGRTLLGGSTVVTQTGASGGGSNNAVEATLETDMLAVLSTQATAAGAHLSHVGNFRVFARVLPPTANTGAVSVALAWGEGDFLNYTQNTSVTFPADAWDNTFRLVDLGQVHIRKAAAGTQRWEGRFLAKSTITGDKIRIDHFFLVPIDEGSGEVSAIARPQTPTSFTGRDSFTGTTAGNALNARVAPTGGTWATSGDATDFLFSDDATDGSRTEPLKRTTAAGGSVGRFAILGTTSSTLVQVESALRSSGLPANTGETLSMGVIARYTDNSNYLRGRFVRWNQPNPTFGSVLTKYLSIEQVIAGTPTQLGNSIPFTVGSSDTWFVIRMLVTVEGQVTVWLYNSTKTQLIGSASGTSTTLATGGTLATGKSGIWDYTDSATSQIRYYDDFSVNPGTTDAAIFASQSLELRSDRVVREDSGGTLWLPPSRYEGDYPTFPAAGKEARSVRTIVKACRNDPTTGADSAIDDLSFRATVTPRYLQLPA